MLFRSTNGFGLPCDPWFGHINSIAEGSAILLLCRCERMRFWLSRLSQRDAEGRAGRLARAVAALALTGSLAACASTMGDKIGDNLPASMGGLPAGAPARAADAPAYPAVHDMPPARTSTVLTEDEVQQAEKDLVRVRTQQQPEPAAAPAKSANAKTANAKTANAKTANKTANKTAKKKPPPQPQE